MARLNIEDTLWKDFRFQELMVKVGSRHAAKGMIVELWTLAQEYWFPNKQYIPAEKITEAGLHAVIDAGLAVLKPEGGYFAVGSEKAFDWLFEKQKSGLASAEARRAKYGTAQPSEKKTPRTRKKAEQPRTDVQRTLTAVEHTPNGPEHARSSLLLSPSSLLSSPAQALTQTQEPYSVGGDAAAPSASGKVNPVGVFLGAYRSAFRGRYGNGARLDIGKQATGRIQQLLADVPLERACALIEAYCGMNDSWFMTRGHDLETFMQNLTKVGLKLDTGRVTTRQEAQRTEIQDANVQAMKDYMAGKVSL